MAIVLDRGCIGAIVLDRRFDRRDSGLRTVSIAESNAAVQAARLAKRKQAAGGVLAARFEQKAGF
ncbi:MAG TPA: hypothetical protein VJ696_04890 [Rhodanobacteraceae bacterium]|nr:hypothetical protein [Rhodanobacteraceae bacterium]